MLPTDEEYETSYVTRGPTLAAVIVLVIFAFACFASRAHAAPVTFAVTAGALTGHYTVETTTPGVRQILPDPDLNDLTRLGGLRHFDCITDFDFRIGSTFSFSGTGGDIELAINRGPFGENWYNVDIRVAPSARLSIFLFSPSAAPFITSEDLSATPPDQSVGDVFSTVTLEETPPPPTGPANILFSSFQTADIRVAGSPTDVPEPSSALLFGFGLMAAAAHRRYRSS